MPWMQFVGGHMSILYMLRLTVLVYVCVCAHTRVHLCAGVHGYMRMQAHRSRRTTLGLLQVKSFSFLNDRVSH